MLTSSESGSRGKYLVSTSNHCGSPCHYHLLCLTVLSIGGRWTVADVLLPHLHPRLRRINLEQVVDSYGQSIVGDCQHQLNTTVQLATLVQEIIVNRKLFVWTW